MIRVALSEAVPGMQLAMPVWHPQRPRNVLLNPGFVLDSPSITRLTHLDVVELYINYPGLEFVDRFYCAELETAYRDFSEIGFSIIDAFSSRCPEKADWKKFDDLLRVLIDCVLAHPAAALPMPEPCRGLFTLQQHSVATAYLSMLLGLKLQGYMVRQRRFIEPRHGASILSLARAALLHDIGLLHLPVSAFANVHAEHDPLDSLWQSHCRLGYDLVSGHVESAVAATVMNHHQCWDGTGFPRRQNWNGETGGLDGRRIHIFARLVAVADLFDELRFEADGRPRPMVRVLKYLCARPVVGRLDPVILQALYEIVPAFQPGWRIRLSDGRGGYIANWRPASPCSPVVALVEDPTAAVRCFVDEPKVIDLSEQRALSIAEVGGVDVSDDAFTLPDSISPQRGQGLHALPQDAA